MGVSIIKNGSNISILGYSINNSSTNGIQTITNANGINVTVAGIYVNFTAGSLPPLKFKQATGSGTKVVSINGVDTSAYTAAQIGTAIVAAFGTGFSGTVTVMAQAATILTLTTSVSGTAFTAFADTPCNCLDIVNSTGTALEYRRDGAGNTMYMPDNSSRLVVGITNANQVSVRRIDVDTTTVTFTAEAITA